MGSCLGALSVDSISALLLDEKEVDLVQVDSELLTLTTIEAGTLTLEDLSKLAQDKRSLDTNLSEIELETELCLTE